MSSGGVVVALEQIVKESRRATSQDLWLSFVAEKPVPSQHQVWAALDGANVLFFEDDILVSADGPWPDPVEEATWTVLVNRVASEESLSGWLQAFAQGLERAGVSGRVRYSKTTSYPAFAIIEEAPWPQMTCFIAHTRSGPPDPPGHWDVSAEATHRIGPLVPSTLATTRRTSGEIPAPSRIGCRTHAACWSSPNGTWSEPTTSDLGPPRVWTAGGTSWRPRHCTTGSRRTSPTQRFWPRHEPTLAT